MLMQQVSIVVSGNAGIAAGHMPRFRHVTSPGVNLAVRALVPLNPLVIIHF
jgi:hypothetical protein